MDGRGRSRMDREITQERGRVSVHQQQARGATRVIKPPTFKKVQVVYYLSKNGQLEHPHFMEVTHLADQHLHLKDVMDRLTVLRGRGMPSLYSWSNKRSYKNGYVWNDLEDNDIIIPSEGGDYVLKGSELIQTCTEKFHHPQHVPVQEPVGFHPNRKLVSTKRHHEPEEHVDEDNANQEEDEESEFEEKANYTVPNTPYYSRCSVGVSTDQIEIQLLQQEENKTTHKNPSTELSLYNSSPPSTTSSTISDKAPENISKRFEDGDPAGNGNESALSRNSVLFNLIACGSVSFRGKSVAPVLKEPMVAGARKSSSLHKGVLCKAAAAKVEVDEEDEMIKCMSENPRFGNLQAEEKEYFSGSIVEEMSEDQRVMEVVEPGLKKSNSYNEERSSKAGMGEEQVVVEEVKTKERGGVKGKCIPRSSKKSSSSSCLSLL